MLSSISTLRFCAAAVAKNPAAGAASTSSASSPCCSSLMICQRRLQSSSSNISSEPMFAKFGKFMSMNIAMSPTLASATVAVGNAAGVATSAGPKSAVAAAVADGYDFDNFDFYVAPSASASSSSLARSILSTPSLMNVKPLSLNQKVLFSRVAAVRGGGSFCGGGVRLSSFRSVPATTSFSSSSTNPTTIVANGYLFDSQAEHRRAISGGSNTVMTRMPLSITTTGRVGGASSSSGNAVVERMGPRVFSPTVDPTSELFSVDMAIESALAATRAKQIAAKSSSSSSSVGRRIRRFTSSSAYPITNATNVSAPSSSSSSLKKQLSIVAAAAAKKKARMEVALQQQASAAAAADRENSCGSSSKRTKIVNTKLAM